MAYSPLPPILPPPKSSRHAEHYLTAAPISTTWWSLSALNSRIQLLKIKLYITFSVGLVLVWLLFGLSPSPYSSIMKNSKKSKLMMKQEAPLTLLYSYKVSLTPWPKPIFKLYSRNMKKKFKKSPTLLLTKKNLSISKSSTKENHSSSARLNSKIKSFKNFKRITKIWKHNLLNGLSKDKTVTPSAKLKNKWKSFTKLTNSILKLRKRELCKFQK